MVSNLAYFTGRPIQALFSNQISFLIPAVTVLGDLLRILGMLASRKVVVCLRLEIGKEMHIFSSCDFVVTIPQVQMSLRMRTPFPVAELCTSLRSFLPRLVSMHMTTGSISHSIIT